MIEMEGKYGVYYLYVSHLPLTYPMPQYDMTASSRVSSLSSYSADAYCVEDSNISGGQRTNIFISTQFALDIMLFIHLSFNKPLIPYF